MAYIGPEGYLWAWVAGALQEDALTENSIHLLESKSAPEEEGASAGEPSQGFIIRDWFGPFLLGPPSPFMRGRCCGMGEGEDLKPLMALSRQQSAVGS